jgi:hypothetical protein
MKDLHSVSVSQLQFNLSRTLGEATVNKAPFYIQNRHVKTHLVLPMMLVTDELMSQLGNYAPSPHQCCGLCSWDRKTGQEN